MAVNTCHKGCLRADCPYCGMTGVLSSSTMKSITETYLKMIPCDCGRHKVSCSVFQTKIEDNTIYFCAGLVVCPTKGEILIGRIQQDYQCPSCLRTFRWSMPWKANVCITDCCVNALKVGKLIESGPGLLTDCDRAVRMLSAYGQSGPPINTLTIRTSEC